MYLNTGTNQLTKLQNGNVIYNGKETPYKDLPRTVIFQEYERGHRNKDGNELTRDDWEPVFLFITHAERNGYPFPTIPPDEFFNEYEAQTTYYKYSEPIQRKRTRKRGETPDDNFVLNMFAQFATQYNIMSKKELETNLEKWRSIAQNHETEETYFDREILRDKDGNKIIDWSQQARQNESNAQIRAFYKWLGQQL